MSAPPAIHQKGPDSVPIRNRTPTVLALACFFCFATLMCLLAGVTVLAPNSSIAGIWTIKPAAFHDLLELAPWSGLSFLLLSILMALAAWGAWQSKRWGWRLAIAIFAAHGIGDLFQIWSGGMLEGLLGVTISAAILIWLTRRKVRQEFR